MLDVSALVVVRERRVLMVQSRGRDVLYLPGGKVEPGESGAAAASREAREETGLRVAPESLTWFATVTTDAHGQGPGARVMMRLFLADDGAAGQEPAAAGEVDAIEWVTSADEDRCPPAGVATLNLLVAADLID